MEIIEMHNNFEDAAVAMRRAVDVLCRYQQGVKVNDFARSIAEQAEAVCDGKAVDLPHIVESVQRAFFTVALDAAGGNVTEAAALLKVRESRLRYQLTKHGLRAA